LALLMWLAGCATGCTLLGAVAGKAPPPVVEAQYEGLAGQTVAVMVWADRGLQIDYPSLQLDMANSLTAKLRAHSDKKKPLEGATFPHSPESVARFQLEHPETEFEPVELTAVRLGVTRVIYVEIDDLSTRSELSGELFRGAATGSIKVVEVAGGKGKVVYEERDVSVLFPPSTPPEGLPRGNDYQMYVGVVDTLAERFQNRFVPYLQDDD
jgi:hypothetical protein